jgi:hypothetical protein
VLLLAGVFGFRYVHTTTWGNEDADYAPFKLYYQNYLMLAPMQTMLRFIPMFIVGCLCNVLVAMFVGKLPLVVFAGTALCEEYYSTRG